MVRQYIIQEARALLTRLDSTKPFAESMTMVSAARAGPNAERRIARHLAARQQELRAKVSRFVRQLQSRRGRRLSPAEIRRRFALLKLRFNAVLDQIDIFADAFTQRSEPENGMWLAGLDHLAEDALRLQGRFYRPPPLICYLDRGHGAAIRRARTRLPGGDKNPVAVIRVPRERMVGSGIAASLIHEVGHQGAALLDLVNTLRSALREQGAREPGKQLMWSMWERWISEIIADFWAMGHLGVGATIGLMGVVTLPRWFVFRINPDNPHPFPWIRAKLSICMGKMLYPHPQWQRYNRIWNSLYPRSELDNRKRHMVAALEAHLPQFVRFLAGFQPPGLRGLSLAEAMPIRERQPHFLQSLFEEWRSQPELMRRAAPSLVFAVLGQMRADNRITPEAEAGIVSDLLKEWSIRRAAGYLPRSIT